MPGLEVCPETGGDTIWVIIHAEYEMPALWEDNDDLGITIYDAHQRYITDITIPDPIDLVSQYSIYIPITEQLTAGLYYIIVKDLANTPIAMGNLSIKEPEGPFVLQRIIVNDGDNDSVDHSVYATITFSFSEPVKEDSLSGIILSHPLMFKYQLNVIAKLSL